jgi:hypothetical protein
MIFDRRVDWKLLLASVPVGMMGTWVLDSMRLVFQRLGMMPELPPMMGRRILNLISGDTRMGANVRSEPPRELESVAGYQVHYANGVILAAIYALVVPRRRLGPASGIAYALAFPEAAMMLAMVPAMGMGVAGIKGKGAPKTLASTGTAHLVWGAALGALTGKAAELAQRV